MFYPKKHYSFHLPFSTEEARSLLEAVTEKNRFLPDKYQKDDELKLLLKFNGDIGQKKFIISQRVKQGQHFIPLIKGTFVDTGKGCIVETDYQLFFGSKLLFLLWNVVSLLLIVVFLIKSLPYYGIMAFAFFLLNNLVAFYNFSMHVNKCKKLLEDVFSI